MAGLLVGGIGRRDLRLGDAGFYGSTGSIHLNQPVVGMAATPNGQGYWLVASDGGIFAFGDAAFHGSTGSIHLNQPIVGMGATNDGRGYYLVASDGGIFSFGAMFQGSAGGGPRHAPIVGMAVVPPLATIATGIARTPNGHGYWVVGDGGQVLPFGNAGYYGSRADDQLTSPVVGIAASHDGQGYWLVDQAGQVTSFGDAARAGSVSPPAPIVGIAANPVGPGYWLVDAVGDVYARDGAPGEGSIGGPVISPVAGMAANPKGVATGWWAPMGASTASVTPASSAPPAVWASIRPWWASPPPRTAAATG